MFKMFKKDVTDKIGN